MDNTPQKLTLSIDYLSDVHVDFYCREYNHTTNIFRDKIKEYVAELTKNKNADTVIIAGDLGHRLTQTIVFLTEMNNVYKNVMFVTGNHDLYLISNSIAEHFKYNSFNLKQELKNWADLQSNIHMLDGNSINIDGFTIAGTAMTWDMTHYLSKEPKGTEKDVIELWIDYMNDAKYIMEGAVHKSYEGMYSSYKMQPTHKPLDYFNKEYSKLLSIQEADVIVSHYAPLKYPMLHRFEVDAGTTFYYFNGREILDKLNPKVWIFGHTHSEIEFQYADTKLLCNPKGYPMENMHFSMKNIIIEKEIV